MAKRWFTWVMLASYTVIWAAEPLVGELPIGVDSRLMQNINSGFTGFLSLSIQVLIAVVGVLFAGMITSQQRSLQRYTDFVLVLYRREYGHLVLFLGLTIITVLVSVLTGARGWLFVTYHILSFALLAGLMVNALPTLFFVPSRDTYLRLMRNFKRNVFRQMRHSRKPVPLVDFGNALRSLAHSKEDAEWKQWLEELHDQTLKGAQRAPAGAEAVLTVSYRSLLEGLRQEPAHAGQITRFFFYSLGVALREKFPESPGEEASLPVGLANLAEGVVDLIATRGSARRFFQGLVPGDPPSLAARNMEDWLTGACCRTKSPVLYEQWYEFLIGRIEQVTAEMDQHVVCGQPVQEDLIARRGRYLHSVIELTLARPNLVSDRLLKTLNENWVGRDNHRLQHLVNNVEEQAGYVLRLLVQHRQEFLAAWPGVIFKVTQDFSVVSAMGNLLRECYSTNIFLEKEELERLPRPVRDQFYQLDHLVEWTMFQVFLSHDLGLFPYAEYDCMWYLVPQDETEQMAYLRACRKYLNSRRQGVGIHDELDRGKTTLASILSCLKHLESEPAMKGFTAEIDKLLRLAREEVQQTT